MQLTRAADYAVRVMVHLAALPPGERATRSEMAASGDVPEAFLSKILQSLTRSGLIVSHRGMAGGYVLGRPAEQVTVLDVVDAIEGPLQLNACVGPNAACDRSAWCLVHKVWDRAHHALSAVLRSESIASLADRSRTDRPDVGVSQWS